MNSRDSHNLHYSHSVSDLQSPKKQRLQREKYQPKIDFMISRFGGNWQSLAILDIGVGYGFFLHMLEELGCTNLYGMDPFEESINLSRRMTRADIRCGRIEDDAWPFTDHAFDLITCYDVVEHLSCPALFFRKAGRYLKKGGMVMLSTPNKQLPYVLRKLPLIGIRDTNPTHINVQPPGYWKDLAGTEGYSILRTWKGEHLTHLRMGLSLLQSFLKHTGIDHRKVPVLNMFEQSFCMALVPDRKPPLS